MRGIAVLGILLINANSFSLPVAARFNLSVGVEKTSDLVIAVLVSILIDQKMMGLFSVLFGAGCVMFAERLERHGNTIWRCAFKRYGLLLSIGVLHTAAWKGDILIVYALSAPIVLLLRKQSPILLLFTGLLLMTGSAVLAGYCQMHLESPQALGSLWYPDAVNQPASILRIFGLADPFLRSIGMMLNGVAVYRSKLMAGQWHYYKAIAVVGLSVGLPLSVANASLQLYSDFPADFVMFGRALTTLGTVPMVLAYVAMIILWGQSASGLLVQRLRAAGRLALTLYISQTILGLVVFRWLFAEATFERSGVLSFVLGVWVLQLWFSGWWASRIGSGPLERLLRAGCAEKSLILER